MGSGKKVAGSTGKGGPFLMSEKYAAKGAEWRKIRLIEKFVEGEKVLDLGCGPGEYGPALKGKAARLVGFDMDRGLLRIAKTRGYDKLVNGKIRKRLAFATGAFDSVWCSEILEHLPDLSIVGELERVAKKRIVITLPNPASPHFRTDPTHILRYSVGSLKDFFSQREGWDYRVIGLGFEDIPLPAPLRKLTTYALEGFPDFSPTVAAVGRRNSAKAAGHEEDMTL